MNDLFSKKLAEMMGKVDEKVLKAKLNSALDMLQRGNTEELAKKINKMDREELINKINEFDKSKLNELNINKEEIKQKVSEADFNKLAQVLGDHGDEIVEKIKDIIK